ncbi:hypothetical protein SPE26_29650 [Bacillus thuringiensis]|uniref:Uncharacterized protein n=1 Tax=Bacillus thuringiensis TaxID=1428 RepID=A0AAW9GHY9_BACTU|nr:hypothetical protein [Bacillus thuringiensis]MDY0854899.1 hypothetical protein [Bacillus thuringiensis]MDY4394817.1 hypothetical protein [Bacillus thuringiensis]
MTLSESLKQLEEKQKQELFTVRGNIILLNDGIVRLEFRPDAFALINEKDIDSSLIFPLTDGEDPSGRNSKYALKLAKGVKGELHVKNLVQTFEVGDFTNPFYIDEEKEEIVYLNLASKIQMNCEFECRKNVFIADIYCCGGSFLEGGFGMVGCGNYWCDDRCCD